ncbi:hypothetical protein GBAR_LOCUS19829 [Geodia barretti]|uniref:Uncharacterized protein n=1 Tax=Geodia barretti TaxID=519541 RepID=A0AA35SV52_GEOBA|nr:hypothetical protein GBAR_LOCUS19829 [Geodia barretti]
MAERQTEFSYHNIELYKSESLGSGSYGGVCKAKCDGLLCAAKIMHPTLFDLRDPGTTTYLLLSETLTILNYLRCTERGDSPLVSPLCIQRAECTSADCQFQKE